MPSEGEVSVDALAQESGLPVSTVRLYQTRGLLPGPRREGRNGYYGDQHRARLRLIAALQERGFSLAGIKELIDGMAAGQSLGAVLGLGDDAAGASTWQAEEPITLTVAELMARLPGVEPTPALLQRIVDAGLVALDDEGRVTVASPSFLDAGERLIAMGVPAETVLDEYDALRERTDEIAARFTEVFRRQFWDPFVADDLPADDVPAVIGALERLGPLAEAVVVLALRHSLQGAAEEFLAAQTTSLGLELPRPGGEGSG